MAANDESGAAGQRIMKYPSTSVRVVILLAALLASPAARAQDPTGENKGTDAGGYNIQQTMEVGYRANWVNGNQDTYDTFINLGSGVRLLDYSVEMRSLGHHGLLFDNLSFSSFGYGGDPNDVSRLRIQKNKYYDFRVLFRRDKNFWDWNLLANPLNPVTTNAAVSPTTPIISSPHALDLVRRMQDYDLTLFPNSRIRWRLGYSRNRDQGPGFFTTDGGTIPTFPENFSYTTNAYRAGVDFRVLPRTTISYDQFLSYFQQNNSVTDNPLADPQNFGFQLANGTPVDLGNVWASSGGEVLPCAAPIVNAATTPPTVNPNCNGFLSYSQVGRPRNFMPTERLRFQSNYFNKFETSGSVGYSTANNSVPDFNETVNDLTARSGTRGGVTNGPADAKRVSVNADWSGVYSVTDNFRIVDTFRYDNWRTPGVWNLGETNIFEQQQPGLSGLEQPQATTCAAPFTAVTCPNHSASSPADSTYGVTSTFLAQNLKSDTFELQYDLNKRLSGRIGYLYTDRTIADFSSTFMSAETYFPGGAGGTAANDFFAARGDCAMASVCTPGANGSLVFSGPAAGNDTSRNLVTINENVFLAGLTVRPMDTLRITGDFEFGDNDNSFTRTDPRHVESYKIHGSYRPRPWISVDGAVDIHENQDNLYTVNNQEHDRMYSLTAMVTASPRLSFNFGYNNWDVYSQIDICYSTGIATGLEGTTPCPTASSPVPLGALAVYTSADHFAYGGVIWKASQRVTASFGYDGTVVRGTSPYFNQPQFAPTAAAAPALQQVTLNALTPSGTLDFNYVKPYGSVVVALYKGLSYKMAWNYYGFNVKGAQNPAGMAMIPMQDFNGSTATFAFRYAF